MSFLSFFKIKAKSLLVKAGVDKAIAFSSGARVVQGFTGIGSIFFIATFLTGVEQGFYFTFGSILSLQVFFELGLTGIMTQFVAHEVSSLNLDNYDYMGDAVHHSRLASLLLFCKRWYAILSIVIFVVLLFFGFVFFSSFSNSSNSSDVSWQLPWILICIGTALKLFQSPFTSILNGLGFVKEMSEITFLQQCIIPLFTWVGLAVGLKLYVVGISYFLSVMLWFVYCKNNHLTDILFNLFKYPVSSKVEYFKEIFPYQWRIALSWISGYFIFQLFNPVLFATEGAVVAGQMGMTLTILTSIQTFSMSWVNTKIPKFSSLIAQVNYTQLDSMFSKTLKQTTSVCLLLLSMMMLMIYLFDITDFTFNGKVIADRFLPYIPMLCMMIAIYLHQYVNAWATYLRCHKKEPFLVFSICCGIACCISTLGLGSHYGLYCITIGYCIIYILFTPWAYYIYKTKKSEWHG
ncbi:hypothetical protein SAMN02910409_0644 [Prevotellaceae bacterium HUN156]|nr:hypothetical protein SAMN02910409_0644 [Prevotellaceae bacterium HUN156]